jgi:SAM-dependent methyltransferase
MTSPFPPEAFRKEDESPDSVFYAEPRMVNHIDDYAIAAVGEAYRAFLPPDGVYLDLMSSWVSHFPLDFPRQRIVGHGMNEEELRANPALSEYVVRDLNEDPVLPFEDDSFDGVVICVSVQYLTRPVEVFAEIGRVLKPGCPLVVAFSNRCFPMKAVRIWTTLGDSGHANLVAAYATEAGAFEDIEAFDFSPRLTGIGVPDELKERVASGSVHTDPMFIVVAKKKTEEAPA